MATDVEFAALDVRWVEEFRRKLEGTGAVLKSMAQLFKVTFAVARFAVRMQDCPHFTWDTQAKLALKVDVAAPTGNRRTNEDGQEQEEVVQDMLDMHWTIPLAVLLQMMRPLTIHLCEACKQIEEDSGPLQEIMGAVSTLRGRVLARLNDNGELEVVEPDKHEVN